MHPELPLPPEQLRAIERLGVRRGSSPPVVRLRPARVTGAEETEAAGTVRGWESAAGQGASEKSSCT